MAPPLAFGPYLLLERLAVGGMAEVYLAARREAPAGPLVAVKRLLPTVAERPELVRLFLDEARLLASLAHPGIVAVHDLGRVGPTYYMALDYVAGRDLRALLDALAARAERLPVAEAAGIAAQLAAALDHAHRRRDAAGAELRVVHRDVSPTNVLVGLDGAVRLVDFGIAQAGLPGRRGDGALRGKPAYMSPELVRGLPADRRSDVFALGAVLHELLTGARLFGGGAELEVQERVRRAAAPPPSAARPEVPPALDAVVLRALARDPGDRHPWASALAEALAPFAAGRAALAARMAAVFPGAEAEERARAARAARAGGEG